MQVEISEINPDALAEYEQVSIAFTVTVRYRSKLKSHGLGGIDLFEETVNPPYIKDYDALPAAKPTAWHERFDLTHWGILAAYSNHRIVGGTAVAWRTPPIFTRETGSEVACLWDLRVAPDYRGKKIGRQLFASAAAWARQRNCRRLQVETQNTNVPACKFYAAQGCELGAIDRFAYPEAMGETQLIWYLNL